MADAERARATVGQAHEPDPSHGFGRNTAFLGRTAMTKLLRLLPDNFTLSIVGALAIGLVLPISGVPAHYFNTFTRFAIALLFFLHGAKLSTGVIIKGVMHWRLHLLVLAATFVMFPMLGIALQFLPGGVINRQLAAGFLFLTLLPSTVQSSVAFTAVAGGNVPSAVCSASLSNLIGMLLTPLLVSALMTSQEGGISLEAVRSILFELLLPFLAGQAVQRWTRPWLSNHSQVVGFVDRGSIVLVVYGAVSAATLEGYWRLVSPLDLCLVVSVSGIILFIMLSITTAMSRRLRFNRADEIAIVFCGSKKSLASGAPLAGALFAPAAVGGLLLPLIVFHQIQLVTCGVLARRYASQGLQPGGLYDR